MFKRKHHAQIANVLQSLDADLLAKHHCFFGGGTAIVLSHDEYRESVDIDFLVSDGAGYRALRSLLTDRTGMNAIVRKGMTLPVKREIRADQYGIRTLLNVAGVEIKFEIVLEGRIKLDEPDKASRICGVVSLTETDMASTKLLANSDRWHDDSVFSRDLIDLAMLNLPRSNFLPALDKASGAYGAAAERDLLRAIEALGKRKGRLEECMGALKMDRVPKALLWQRIRDLKKPHAFT